MKLDLKRYWMLWVSPAVPYSISFKSDFFATRHRHSHIQVFQSPGYELLRMPESRARLTSLDLSNSALLHPTRMLGIP